MRTTCEGCIQPREPRLTCTSLQALVALSGVRDRETPFLQPLSHLNELLLDFRAHTYVLLI